MAWYKCANDTDIKKVLRQPVNIYVESPPNKIEYIIGEALDLTGIIVRATLGTGETIDVTDKCVFSPANGETLTTSLKNIAITYTYGEKVHKTICEIKVKIVTWSSGTDEEIVKMVAASEAGIINLADYWTVGDERQVTLSAMDATGVGESHAEQTVTFVLMHQGLYKLTDDSNCNFIVGQKNGLSESGYMNSTSTNSGSWDGCARRTWCNSIYYNAIPSTLRPIFKQFKTVTAKAHYGSTNQTSIDYFALPAEKEVYGSRSYANSTEANALTQFDYYKTSANNIKKQGDNGSASFWWERSPYSGDSNSFCIVDSGGSESAYDASSTYLLAPFGCI